MLQFTDQSLLQPLPVSSCTAHTLAAAAAGLCTRYRCSRALLGVASLFGVAPGNAKTAAFPTQPAARPLIFDRRPQAQTGANATAAAAPHSRRRNPSC